MGPFHAWNWQCKFKDQDVALVVDQKTPAQIIWAGVEMAYFKNDPTERLINLPPPNSVRR